MTDRGLVRAAAYRSLARTLRELVGDRADALLESAGLAGDISTDAMMSWHTGASLLEDIARIADRDDIAIVLARKLPWADFGVLAYVVLHAPTLGAALTHLRRYLAIQQQVGEVSLVIADGVATVRYTLRRPPHEPPRQHALFVLALIVRVIRDGLGDAAWHPTRVAVPLAAPARASDLSYFGAPVDYGADAAAIAFAADALRQPMVTADAGLFPILVRHADECLAKLPAPDDTAVDQIRRLVSSLLGEGTIAIDDVAARMGSSARTIQRQLHAHGSSFKQVVDEVRLGMARRHLADPAINLTDAAFLLGYSDLSAFSRAFRRWTGQSPQEFRRVHVADSGSLSASLE